MTFVRIVSFIVIFFLRSSVMTQVIYSNLFSSSAIPDVKPPSGGNLHSSPITCYFTTTNCFFNDFPSYEQSSSSNAPLYVFNKRQLDPMHRTYVTLPVNFRPYQSKLRLPSVLYGKLAKQNSNFHRIVQKPLNSIKVNDSAPHRLRGNLNTALNKRNQLLRSIYNPRLFEMFARPNKTKTKFANTTGAMDTRRTVSVSTPTASHYNNSNETKTTKKSLDLPPKYDQWNSVMYNNYEVMTKFMQALDTFERKFYKITFAKLSSISPKNRKENGISFAQTGLFLQLALMAISSEVDEDTQQEIEQCLGLYLTTTEKIYVLKEIMSSLPNSNEALKFRFSSRLVLDVRHSLKPQLQHGLAPAMKLNIDRVNTSDTAEALTITLNKMVEKDSGGTMHDTFEEDELLEGVCAALLSTMYLRPRWRSAPTVLNGTHAFNDDIKSTQRFMRMIRINDMMRYAELNEWDAEAIEIFYATPGLSLLLLVPRSRSLRNLSAHLAETSIHEVLQRMYSLRVAVSLPLYTLRMTLLVPGKLKAMGISRLVDVGNGDCGKLKLSQAVQRLMFWAEAGRNAYKDDGIEWDESPELELVVNRPYIFFVRWRNITIMNGHFVL